MCLAVYLASNIEVHPIAWNSAAPAYFLQPVVNDHAVRKQFSLQFVYYVGSHQGCGCGFSKDGEIGKERDLCQENYTTLGRTLREAICGGTPAELFTCWEGDQGEPPESIHSVTPAEIEEADFQLQELQKLVVSPDA
jgi:hypothetical protein